jgi:hypothetical protein
MEGQGGGEAQGVADPKQTNKKDVWRHLGRFWDSICPKFQVTLAK